MFENLIGHWRYRQIIGSNEAERMRPKDSEVERLLGCNTKIGELCGWRPQYDLSAGLQQTIAWFSRPENLARYKSEIYNI